MTSEALADSSSRAVRASLAGIPGALPSVRKKLKLLLADMQFQITINSTVAFSSEFVTFYTVESSKKFPPAPSLHSRYFYANLDEIRDLCFRIVGRCVPSDSPVSPLAYETLLFPTNTNIKLSNEYELT